MAPAESESAPTLPAGDVIARADEAEHIGDFFCFCELGLVFGLHGGEFIPEKLGKVFFCSFLSFLLGTVQAAYFSQLAGVQPETATTEALVDLNLLLDDDGPKLLEEMGLVTRQVRRTVKTGKEVIETIFSTSAGYVQLYEKRFGDRPIDKSAQTQRLEGFLFGFPPCCVDEYIRHPYIKNGLDPQDQKILFHWACRDCKITALLLGAYKKVHNFLDNC